MNDLLLKNSPLSGQRSRGIRISGLITTAIVVAIVTALAWTYFEEKPLRDADKALAEQNPQRALALVNFFLDSHPDHELGLAMKARAMSALGNADEAIALYEKYGAETTKDVHVWARCYMLRGQWTRALPLLLYVLANSPNDHDALYEITSCRVRLGLLDDALESAGRLAALPGQQSRGYVFLGAIYNDLGNQQKSVEAYRRATEISPDGSKFPMPAYDVFLQYGSVLLSLGQPKEALSILEKSFANRPTPSALVLIGDALSQLGRAGEARDAWEASLKMEPTNGHAREALANAALQRGEPGVGLELLQPLAEAGQARQSTAYLIQRIHSAMGNAAEASVWQERADALRKKEQRETALEELVVRSPQSYWANVVRAHRFAAKGDWQQAEDMMEGLYQTGQKDTFVTALYQAIKNRSELPSLDDLPIHNF